MYSAQEAVLIKKVYLKYTFRKYSNYKHKAWNCFQYFLDKEKGIYNTKGCKELQLAKEATYGGIMVLIGEPGMKTDEVKKVYLVVGYENYSSVESTAQAGDIIRRTFLKGCLCM